MRYIEQLKKIFVLAVATLSISIVGIGPVKSDATANYYLAQISQNTYNLLQFIQNPGNFAGLAISWLQQDTGDSSIITQTQQQFATMGAVFTISKSMQTALQPKITSDLLGRPPEDFGGKNPTILVDLPNVNDLVYSTLMGTPPVPSAPVDLYAYIKNASGFSIHHPIPEKVWQGDEEARERYTNYYNTITSIQSFNSYIISQLAIDSSLKSGVSQDQLVTQASSSSWISQIATEELGRVLRQILLFESQNYVLNTQIQQSLRSMVAAQAMTNSLLIAMNYTNENQMIRNAKGLPLGE